MPSIDPDADRRWRAAFGDPVGLHETRHAEVRIGPPFEGDTRRPDDFEANGKPIGGNDAANSPLVAAERPLLSDGWTKQRRNAACSCPVSGTRP
jgi:hypothetical protein